MKEEERKPNDLTFRGIEKEVARGHPRSETSVDRLVWVRTVSEAYVDIDLNIIISKYMV